MLMNHEQRHGYRPSVLAFLGALLAAAAIGLSAYAAHGVGDTTVVARLQMSALFAFGHGIALAALGPSTRRTLGRVALWVLFLATVGFSGGIALGALTTLHSPLTPSSGSAMMLAWVVWGVDALRRK